MSRTVIENTTYFDALNGKMHAGQTIVSEGSTITWIGDAGSFEREAADHIIAGEGKYLIPGMMDCHTHLSFKPSPYMEKETVRTNDDMYHYIALKHAQDHLIAGFTTVREVGTMYPRVTSSMKRIIDQGMFTGPRILSAAAFLSQYGRAEEVGPDALREFARKREASGRDEIIRGVRQRRADGADLIKTQTTGGVLHGQASKLQHSLWRDEELEIMVDEAHRLDMHCAAHAHGDYGIMKAAAFGFDTIEHGTYMSEETAELMIKNGTYLIPTETAVQGLKKPEIYAEMAPEVKIKIDQANEHMFANHKMAFEKGVNIAVGTDCGTPANPHGATAVEVANMVNVIGMTPTQALQAATIEAAKAIKIPDLVGSITVGKSADMVLLEKNPVDDISVLQDFTNILKVVMRGKPVAEKGKLIP